MKNHVLRPFLNCLVVLALVLSGISPACEFISGKTSTIEICGADGFAKTVEVAADVDPFSDNQSEDKVPEHRTKKQCAFCFAAHHFKGASAHAYSVQSLKDTVYENTFSVSAILSSRDLIYYHATGPPAVS